MNQGLHKKLSVVFFSDIVGYTQLMGKDEDGAYDLMKQNVKIHEEIFEKYNGIVIKELGDGVLGTFETAQDALRASLEIQKVWIEKGSLKLRIGLHAGEIIHDRGDIFGDAVNVASRIQSIGVPSCVIFSKQLKDSVVDESEFPNVKLGEFKLKNVARELQLFALSSEPLVIPKREEMINTIKFQERQPWKKFLLIAVIALAIGALVNSLFLKEAKPNWEKDKSIAVLPLKNLNSSQSREYFSDGLTEDIITHLSRIQSIRVISRSSTALYKFSQESNQEIALALGVSTLLEGSVQWAGDALRIRVRLIDATSNQTIWAETFDPEVVEDLFQVQTTIAETIAESLQAEVSMSELEQIQERPTASYEAYQEYLEARGLYYDYEQKGNKASIQKFKDAIAIDSTFALAWAGLGDAYAQMYGLYNFDPLWLDSSIVSGKKAIEINPRLVEGHKALGSAYYYNSQYSLAELYLEKAVELGPNNAQAVGNLATLYFINGELDKSLDLQRKAVDLNPKSHIPLQILGWNYRLLENQEEAQRWLRKSISLKPEYDTYEQLGLSFLAQGKRDSVALQIDRLAPLIGDDPIIDQTSGILTYYMRDFDQAQVYFEQANEKKDFAEDDPYYITPIYLADLMKRSGQAKDAAKIVEGMSEFYDELLAQEEYDKDFAVHSAAISLVTGNQEKAFSYLDLAYELKFQDYMIVDQNPLFDSIKDSPEFILWVEKIKADIRLLALNSWAKSE